MKRPHFRLSLRVRWAIWVAGLTSLAGGLVLLITLTWTARLLHDRAPRLAANSAGQQAPGQQAPGQQGGTPPATRPDGSVGPPPTRPDGSPGPAQSSPLATPTGKALADRTLNDARRIGLWSLGSVVLGSVVVAWIVAGRMLRPVKKVTDAARQMSGAGNGRRINYRGPRDELHDLAATFDAMLDRVDATFNEQKSFVANASHELRTPLALMRSEIDVALDGGDEAEQRGALAELRTSVDRMTALIERMLHLSRAGTMVNVEPYDLSIAAENAIRSTTRLGSALPEPLVKLFPAPVRGDSVLLDQLAANLVENAFAYRPDDGDVWINTRTDGEWSYLEVENDGPIVDPSTVDELFDRFRRRSAVRRTAGRGFGLGLTIVSTIVQTHGGTVKATARPQGGLKVVVRLPRPGNLAA